MVRQQTYFSVLDTSLYAGPSLAGANASCGYFNYWSIQFCLPSKLHRCLRLTRLATTYQSFASNNTSVLPCKHHEPSIAWLTHSFTRLLLHKNHDEYPSPATWNMPCGQKPTFHRRPPIDQRSLSETPTRAGKMESRFRVSGSFNYNYIIPSQSHLQSVSSYWNQIEKRATH